MNEWEQSESAKCRRMCWDNRAFYRECESSFQLSGATLPEGGIPKPIMWDTKRQIIWLVAGVSFGTFIVYNDAKDEFGRFDPTVFVFWEIILLAIIVTLFWLYSRKKT